MRILHIMAGRHPGGAETYSTDVMLSLHKAGVEQCVVMSKKAPRYGELKAAGLNVNSNVLALPFRPLQRLLLKMLVKKYRPDILHCWMRRAASLVPRQRTEDRHQGSEKRKKQKTKNLSSDPCRRPSVIGWFGGYYDPRRFQHCSHFVGVTKDITAHMVKHGVPADRAYFIPTFPDIAALPPIDRMTLATPHDVKIVLALSRLHPKKGLDTLLTALPSLSDCYVWLAGEGPLRRELENLAKKLGVIDRVRFLGWRTDRAALLRAADLCVLPSRYEPFGTVILEAWAAGTPLVACRSAGPAAHIDDDVNGLLVPIDDAPALASAMRRVLDSEDLRRRLIAQGYATYIKSYTPEAVTQQWLQYYKGLTA